MADHHIVYRSRQEEMIDNFVSDNPEIILGVMGVTIVAVIIYSKIVQWQRRAAIEAHQRRIDRWHSQNRRS